jgi:hypothetical protein
MDVLPVVLFVLAITAILFMKIRSDRRERSDTPWIEDWL